MSIPLQSTRSCASNRLTFSILGIFIIWPMSMSRKGDINLSFLAKNRTKICQKQAKKRQKNGTDTLEINKRWAWVDLHVKRNSWTSRNFLLFENQHEHDDCCGWVSSEGSIRPADGIGASSGISARILLTTPMKTFSIFRLSEKSVPKSVVKKIIRSRLLPLALDS